MRILFLSPVGGIGGAEGVLLTAVAAVRRDRPSAVVRVLLLADGPLTAAVCDLGAEVEVIPAPAAVRRAGDSRVRGQGWRGRAALGVELAGAAAGTLRLAFRVRAAVRRFRPDVVHSNGVKTHLLTPFAVPRAVPVVWHAHDFYSLRPVAAALLRRACRRVRAVIAISDAVAADVRRVLPGVPCATVRNRIDLGRFSPGPAAGNALDAQAGRDAAPPGTLRVGLVAAYATWKGHLVVLDAAAVLPDVPLRWYLVGGPIYQTAAQLTEAELRGAAAARGVADRVAFVGFTADTPRVYRGLDVVVHASTLPEPFGLTVAEAMACGRPVIVSAAGGAAELFTDGVDAVGFSPGNAGQLAAAVRRLAGDADLRTRLGAAARRTAEQRFGDRPYGGQLLAVYDHVTGRRAAKTNGQHSS